MLKYWWSLPPCTLLFPGFLLGCGGFQRLLRQADRSRRHAFALGTYSNLQTQFRSYFGFCVYFHRTPLPADLDTVCGYVQFLSRSLKPPSIANYMSGVKLLHILLGYEYGYADNIHLQLLIRGIKRLCPHTPRRAKPVVPVLLASVATVADTSSSLHLATVAVALLLFHTLARLGSILPASLKSKRNSFLHGQDIGFTSYGMVVSLSHTKTIQFGERCLRIPLVARDGATCPVAAYFSHLRLLGRRKGRASSPAFVYRDSKGVVCWLTKSIFIKTFRDLAARAGDSDPAAYSGHSFRRGGASWAFQAGLPGELIQVMGDWSSDAYRRYLEFNMRNKQHLHSVFSSGLP